MRTRHATSRATAAGRRRLAVLAAPVAVALCCASGCGGDDERRELVVFAAASLTETFADLSERFEAANPDVRVTLQFAGSSTLAAQITAGAPADIFAAASPATMQRIVDAGDTQGAVQTFARNRLALAVPPGNPGAVRDLSDLAEPDLDIAMCAPEVPCGAVAEAMLAAAGVVPAPDTQERDVKAVLTKVELGEVDAGLVYRSDIAAAGDRVEGIEIRADQSSTDYQIVAVAGAAEDLAAAWIDFVRSAAARELLVQAGFEVP